MNYQINPNMNLKDLCICLLITFYICSSCNGQTDPTHKNPTIDTIPKQSKQNDISLPGSFSIQSSIRMDSAQIKTFMNKYPGFKAYETRIRQFYSKRNYAYAWFDHNGLIEQSGNLYNKIENIKEEGLPGKILYAESFQQMMNEDSSGNSIQKEDPFIDLMLTAQYFYYAENVWEGLGTKAMQAVEWDLPKKKISYDAYLDSLLDIPSSSFMLTEPVFRQYALLKSYLKKYRNIDAAGGWPEIKADKKDYRKGDSSKAITAIRKRLIMSGDLFTDDQTMVFNDELETAVKVFQQRYGLKDDGIINSKLITEMNYPVEKRIEQIIVNMERCRWLPVVLKKDYLVVNVPEFRFHAFENDSLVWSMNVVVGTVMNKTAIFNGTLNNVVFSPYWNIPPGIMQKETLPAIRRDKNYLSRNHMEWNGNAIRQKPGPWNALGKVKFLFPNSHSIYLHDTPGKTVFGNDQRAFSHGCIRVSDPKRLAIYVLRKQPEWTEDKIDAAMNASIEKYVKISNPVPVFIAYFTSWVDTKGKLNFRNDIYKKDSRLAKMIIENSGL